MAPDSTSSVQPANQKRAWCPFDYSIAHFYVFFCGTLPS